MGEISKGRFAIYSKGNMNFQARQKFIHFWAPNIYGFHGGIQAFSLYLFQALQELGYLQKLSLKLDREVDLPKSAQNFSCYGQYPWFLRTMAFSAGVTIQSLFSKPSLVLSTHLNFAPVAYYLKKYLNIPYWVVAHGVDAWKIEGILRRLAFAKADKILAVSNYTRSKIMDSFDLDPESILILHNTFDEERFSIAKKSPELLCKYALQHDNPVILSVCRFDAGEQYKGYDLVLESIPSLLVDFPSLRYVVVGQGNDLDRFRNKVVSLGLEKQVIIVGGVSNQDLPKFYQLCDVFALPSLGEGFGIVFLEALASGKPVIGGNLDGSVEPLQNGELGVLINPRSKNEFSAAVANLLSQKNLDPLLYNPEHLRRQVVLRFGRESFKRRVAEIFKDIGMGGYQ